MQIFGSVSDVRQAVAARRQNNLAIFPARVFAHKHSPNKEPLVETDEAGLLSAVEQAIFVSLTELAGDGAEIHWPQ